MAGLEVYCDRVACAVGRLSNRIFGVDDATGDLYIAESRPVLRHWNIGACARCHTLPPD